MLLTEVLEDVLRSFTCGGAPPDQRGSFSEGVSVSRWIYVPLTQKGGRRSFGLLLSNGFQLFGTSSGQAGMAHMGEEDRKGLRPAVGLCWRAVLCSSLGRTQVDNVDEFTAAKPKLM